MSETPAIAPSQRFNQRCVSCFNAIPSALLFEWTAQIKMHLEAVWLTSPRILNTFIATMTTGGEYSGQCLENARQELSCSLVVAAS